MLRPARSLPTLTSLYFESKKHVLGSWFLFCHRVIAFKPRNCATGIVDYQLCAGNGGLPTVCREGVPEKAVEVPKQMKSSHAAHGMHTGILAPLSALVLDHTLHTVTLS